MQDAVLMFSVNQEITGTTDADKYINTDVITNAEAKQLTVNCVVTKTFSGITSMTVKLIQNSGETSSGGDVIVQTGDIPASKLVAGTRIPIHLRVPFRDTDNEKKNLFVNYTVSGTGTGAVTTGIEYMPQTNI